MLILQLSGIKLELIPIILIYPSDEIWIYYFCIQPHIGFDIIIYWVMSKSAVNEDDLSSITSHFFEPGEDAGTFWYRLCITSGNHKGKAYEAPRGRTNFMKITNLNGRQRNQGAI